MKQDAVTDESLKALVDVYEGYTTATADEVTTYQVYTANGLYAWATATEADAMTGLKLMADITLPNKDLTTGANITVTDGKPSGSNWTPMGKNSAYTGSIDGNGKTITGLRIYSESDNTGFVGLYTSNEIRNLHRDDVAVYSSKNYVGGIVGLLSSPFNIRECSVKSGSVISDMIYVGGIVGNLTVGNVIGCTNAATVTGLLYVGGIVGQKSAGSNGIIAGCFNSGTVTTNMTSSHQYGGGIVGSDPVNAYTVIACVNTGNVVNAAGIIGENAGTVIASYTTQNSAVVNSTGSIKAVYFVLGEENDAIDGTNCVSVQELNSEVVVAAMNTAIDDWTDSDGNACAYKWQIGTTYPELIANTAN